MYHVRYSPASEKFIRKLNAKLLKKIKLRMEQVADNPFAHDSNLEKIKEMPHGYRLRIGDIRLVYEIDTATLTIIVWKTNWRALVYKK